MKYTLMLSLIIGFLSCGTSKSTDSDEVVTVQEEPMYVETLEYEGRPQFENEVLIEMQATVRLKEEGCPVLLEVVDGDLYFTAYPVNLAPEFQVEGMKISLGIRPSKAPTPAGCNADKIVSVHQVNKL
jgi:hypothetical protein